MSKKQSRKWYAVIVGHEPGVYDSWEGCKTQVHRFPGALFKSFDSKQEAIDHFRKTPPTPSQESSEATAEKRDQFIAAALACCVPDDYSTDEELAIRCCNIADAVMIQRQK